MKKNKESRIQKLMYLSFGILALIAVIFIAASPSPVHAAGLVTAMAIMVGGIELTGKEEALFNAFTEHINKEVGKFGKGYISEQKMLDTIADKIKEFNLKIEDNEEFKKLTKALEKQGLELVALKENGLGGRKATTIKDAVAAGFAKEGMKDKIIQVVSRKSGLEEIVTIKAAAIMTTGNVTTTTGGIALLDLANSASRSIAKLAETFVENFATLMVSSQPVLPYADYIPKEGDVAFIGESGTAGLIDGKVEIRYATPKKAAGYEILTDESVKDIPQMESFAYTLLFKKYLLKRQSQILFGNGIGDNPIGVATIAAAFNPLSWTGAKIPTPNLLDVLRACANQIYITKSWDDDEEYLPNVVYVNPADWFSFIGTKATNGMYVFPQFTFGENNSIDNLVVIPKTKIPSGKILIGDFSKLVIADWETYNVKAGYINDQIIKGQSVIVGDGRFFTYVKEYDKRAFIYDDIANVITGIESV